MDVQQDDVNKQLYFCLLPTHLLQSLFDQGHFSTEYEYIWQCIRPPVVINNKSNNVESDVIVQPMDINQTSELNFSYLDINDASDNIIDNNWFQIAIFAATRDGYLKLLEELSLYNNEFLACIQKDSSLITIAVEQGHLEILKWLKEKECYWDSRIIFVAVKKGQVEILQWLIEIGHCCSNFIVDTALVNGQLEVLKWLRRAGYHGRANICSVAASYGHIKILEWLRINNHYWNTKEVRIIAYSKNLIGVIRWLDSIESGNI